MDWSNLNFSDTNTSLPEYIADREKVSAKYTDGILEIHIPKREEARPKPARNIEIS